MAVFRGIRGIIPDDDNTCKTPDGSLHLGGFSFTFQEAAIGSKPPNQWTDEDKRIVEKLPECGSTERTGKTPSVRPPGMH